MTPFEYYSINYTLNQLSKRLLSIYFHNANPSLFIKSQAKLHRQIHVISAYFLNKWLNSKNLRYNIIYTESWFLDSTTQQKYDHSWLYLESLDNESNYICDLGRISTHIGLVVSPTNFPTKFIPDIEISNSRIHHNWQTLLKEKEFFTEKPVENIIIDITSILKDYKLLN